MGAKLGGGGRRQRGAAAGAGAVALFGSWLVLVCLAGIHGVAAGKATMAPHPHQGKVKVRRCHRALRLFALRARLYRVLLDTDVFHNQNTCCTLLLAAAAGAAATAVRSSHMFTSQMATHGQTREHAPNRRAATLYLSLHIQQQ